MTEPSEKRAVGRPAHASEQAVLAAALESFAVTGYEGTSVRTLNKQLGLSHNSIQQRFGTKEQLWHRAVDNGFSALIAKMDSERARAEPNEDPMVLLHQEMHRFVRISIDHPLHLMLMTHEGTRSGPRLDYIFETYIRPILAPFGDHFRALQTQGRIRPMALRTLFMLVVHGAIAPYTLLGLSQQFDDDDGPFDPVEHATTVTALIISGLQRQP